MTIYKFVYYIFSTPYRKLKSYLFKREIGQVDSLKDRFTLIYLRNAWSSKESISGNGSTLKMTESIRESLPLLFKEFSISSIFDAPCGDFNWMRLVDLQEISYVGGDIVEPLVRKCNLQYSSERIIFMNIDITKEVFPKSDLVLNRDCLFHFSYQDIYLTLSNFLESRSKYFLSTSHDNVQEFRNLNIRSGAFRKIDLFSTPFNFPTNYHFRISEPGEGTLPSRSLYLWDRTQVKVGHSNLESFLSGL